MTQLHAQGLAGRRLSDAHGHPFHSHRKHNGCFRRYFRLCLNTLPYKAISISSILHKRDCRRERLLFALPTFPIARIHFDPASFARDIIYSHLTLSGYFSVCRYRPARTNIIKPLYYKFFYQLKHSKFK